MQVSDDSKEQAIRGLRDYASGLTGTLRRLRADLDTVERSIALLEGSPPPEQPPLFEDNAEYRNLKPQAAVEKYLAEHPGEKLKPSELAKKLLALGLPKSCRAFSAAIAGALTRAESKGIARKGRDAHGRNVYSFLVKDQQGMEADDEKMF